MGGDVDIQGFPVTLLFFLSEHFPDGEVTAEGCGHLAFPHPSLLFTSILLSPSSPMSDRVTINTKEEEKEKSPSIQKP